jgi:hypothetical protein
LSLTLLHQKVTVEYGSAATLKEAFRLSLIASALYPLEYQQVTRYLAEIIASEVTADQNPLLSHNIEVSRKVRGVNLFGTPIISHYEHVLVIMHDMSLLHFPLLPHAHLFPNTLQVTPSGAMEVLCPSTKRIIGSSQ